MFLPFVEEGHPVPRQDVVNHGVGEPDCRNHTSWGVSVESHSQKFRCVRGILRFRLINHHGTAEVVDRPVKGLRILGVAAHHAKSLGW